MHNMHTNKICSRNVVAQGLYARLIVFKWTRICLEILTNLPVAESRFPITGNWRWWRHHRIKIRHVVDVQDLSWHLSSETADTAWFCMLTSEIQANHPFMTDDFFLVVRLFYFLPKYLCHIVPFFFIFKSHLLWSSGSSNSQTAKINSNV